MWRKGIGALLALIAVVMLGATTATPFAPSYDDNGTTEQLDAPSELLDCAPSGYESAGTSTRPRAAVTSLVTNPIAARDPALSGEVNACLAQMQTTQSALASEIRFAGDWQPAQIDMVLTALARYEAIIGEDRLISLIQTALSMGVRSGTQLTVVRESGQGAPVAYWAPSRGEIVLNDSLFDPAYLEQHYVWAAFFAFRDTSPDLITIQDAIVAHEIGHVIVDALQIEQQTLDPTGPSLEALYRYYINPAYWPHVGAQMKENLATEFALVSLDITRPGGSSAFRSKVMLPVLAGTYWTTDHALSSFSAASADSGR